MCSSLAETRINLENYTEWKIAVFQLSWQVSSMLSARVREYLPNLILCFQKPSDVHWLKLYYAFVIWPFAAGAHCFNVLLALSCISIIILRWSLLCGGGKRRRIDWVRAHQTVLIRATAGPCNWQQPTYSIVAILSILQRKTSDYFRVVFLFLSAHSVDRPLALRACPSLIHLFVCMDRNSDVLMCRRQCTFN